MSNLELNKGDNFIFGIDVSASMQATDTPNGAQRIDYLKEQVQTFIGEAAKYDDDGIDVITFGHSIKTYKSVTPARASEIIAPLRAQESATDTAGLSREAYRLHKDGRYAQTVLFVATDGSPSDPSGVRDAIRTIAAEITDEHEFAISILTVGKPDANLESFLRELDDNLKAKHDIVDVKRLEEVDFMSAFAGALHD